MDLIEHGHLRWDHYTDDRFDYPIDYWGAVLDIRDDGHVDVLYRWEPNRYCHFHRHVAPISSVVLAGELHVIDYVDGQETGRRVRKVGDWAHKEGVEDHIEMGGPQGALVMFSLFAPDGRLTQQLGPGGEVLNIVTTQALQARHQALL